MIGSKLDKGKLDEAFDFPKGISLVLVNCPEKVTINSPLHASGFTSQIIDVTLALMNSALQVRHSAVLERSGPTDVMTP